MKLNLKIIISFTFLVFTNSYTQTNYKDTLDIKLNELSRSNDIPGFGVAIVSKEKVLYAEGFGYANVLSKISYTSSTVQNIGSTSKTVIAFALMKLVDEGKLKLDASINDYIPYRITNPNFPNEDITIRYLATHTSSLTDGKDDMIIEKSYLFNGDINFTRKQFPDDYWDYFQIYKTNKKKSLKKFVKNSYCSNGKWYSKDNFTKYKPGTSYHYSNIGSALLAYIIEEVSGKSYKKFTEDILFKPLQMTNTSWSYKSVAKDQLSSVYLSNGLHIPNYDLNTYPDGGMYTSISDFALYLREMIKGLNGESGLLSKQSFKEMMSNQLVDEKLPNGDFENSKGLLWTVNKDGDNISANGADPGIASWTMFTTQGNIGIALFMNQSIDGNEDVENEFKAVRGTVFKYIGQLIKELND